MRKQECGLLALVCALAIIGVMSRARAEPVEQGAPTATPAQVDLLNGAPVVEQANATETPTRTPTPLGVVQIEAREAANVRAQPDTSAELLGEIRAGEYYNAIRRYYRWIEFQYDPAPNHRGWVFDELVNVIGDPNAIPIVDTLEDASEEVAGLDATFTEQVMTLTPGGLLTATAVARTGTPVPSPAISELDPGSLQVVQTTEEATQRVVLPTFTFPPGVVALAPTQPAPGGATPTQEVQPLPLAASGEIPPLIPIVALGALGLMGLLASSIRR